MKLYTCIKLLFIKEHNSRIHLLLTATVLLAGIIVQLSHVEWLFMALSIAIVFISELFNTALERLADKVEPNFDSMIGAVKDYASGAVLVASIFAIVVGLVIFGPKIMSFTLNL